MRTPSLRRYLRTSFSLHLAVCALIVFSITRGSKKIEVQEAVFLTQLSDETERIKNLALEARKDAAKNLLRDQTLLTLEELLEDNLSPEDRDLLIEQTMQDIKERIEERSASEQLELLLEEELSTFSQSLSKDALEHLRMNLAQLKQDMLLQQVRTFIRKKVAPTIQEEIETNLKQKLGTELKSMVLAANQNHEKTQRALKHATQKIKEQVRKKITQEIQNVAIPLASERIAHALKSELKKRKLETKDFKEFIEKDIQDVLAKEMEQQPPAPELALMQLEREFNISNKTPLEETTKHLAEVAQRLKKLAEQERTFRAEVPEDTPSRDAMKQHLLADQIQQTRKQAERTLKKARKHTMQHDRLVETANKSVRNPTTNKKAIQAAQAMERELVNDAKSMMTEIETDLQNSAIKLESLNKALRQELTSIPNPIDQTTKKEAQLTKKLLQNSEPIIEKRVPKIVHAAVHSLNLHDLMGSDETLESVEKMETLTEQLDQLAENVKEGRALDEALGLGLLGPRQGKTLGRLPSLEKPPWANRNGGRMEQINLRAYKKFVEDMRDRLDPDNYYNDVTGSQNLVTQVPESKTDVPAFIFRDKITKKKDLSKEEKRTIPHPSFKTIEFGAAAMMVKKPTIDGDLSDWGELRHGLELRYTDDRFEKGKTGPTVYVRWSPDGLYFAYTVKDPNGIQASPQNPWDGDALEIMLDMANSRRPDSYLNVDSQKITLTPFGCMGHSSWRLSEMGRGLRGLHMGQAYPDRGGIKGNSAARQHNGGYTVEGFISRRALAQASLSPGKYVGLNFCLNRGAGARTYQWSASQKIQTWRHPDTWGDLLLLGSDAKLNFTHNSSAAAKKPKPITPGEVLQLQIEDADMNINTRKVDRISADVFVKGEGNSLFVILGETGKNTGVFQASVQTQAYFKDAKEKTINLRSGSTIQFIYSDARTEYGEKNRQLTKERATAWPILQLGKRK